MKKETQKPRYTVTISFHGWTKDGYSSIFKHVDPLIFECTNKNELFKELKELNLENEKSVSRVLIEDHVTLNEYYYSNLGNPDLPPYSLERLKHDMNQ